MLCIINYFTAYQNWLCLCQCMNACLSCICILIFAYEPRHEISDNVVCPTSKGSDQPAHMRSLIRAFACRLNILTEHHLEFLSFKGGCTGLSESTLVKMPHCWKSHVAAHIYIRCQINPSSSSHNSSCYLPKRECTIFRGIRPPSCDIYIGLDKQTFCA